MKDALIGNRDKKTYSPITKLQDSASILLILTVKHVQVIDFPQKIIQ